GEPAGACSAQTTCCTSRSPGCHFIWCVSATFRWVRWRKLAGWDTCATRLPRQVSVGSPTGGSPTLVRKTFARAGAGTDGLVLLGCSLAGPTVSVILLLLAFASGC